MKFSGLGSLGHRTRDTNLRHNFAIGPFCDTYLFDRPARLYYCTRCTWSFLVAGAATAVIDKEGRPLAGEESEKRFRTFGNGPCPVLEGLAHELGLRAPADLPANGSTPNVQLPPNRGADTASPMPHAPAFRSWLRHPGWHRRDFRWQA
jgi:hypothetical protein